MKNVYVLLTRSQTLLSRLIRACTGDGYTHVSVAFDDELRTLLSFARRRAALPLPAGLVRERLDDGYYDAHRYIPCALYALGMDDADFRRIRRRAETMFEHSRAYDYSIRGLALCRLGIAERRPGKYFCSQFVGELLGERGGLRLPKPPELMRPQDFAGLRELRCLYRGRLSGLMHDPRRILNVDFQ